MKKVTLQKIAKELGFSISTVSRALSGDDSNVNRDTMRYIQQSAISMGYQRDTTAVSFRSKRSFTIGMIAPKLEASFSLDVLTHASRILRQHGYICITMISHEDSDTEKFNLSMMEQYHVDGVLMNICDESKNISHCKRLQERGVPVVFFDRTLKSEDATQVCIDDYGKACEMTEFLLSNGRKNILFLSGPERIYNSEQRLKGFRDTLEKHGISFDERYVQDGGIDAESGKDALKQFLNYGLPFDAVFGFTEMPVIGVKNLLQLHNYRIPQDVALCSFSGSVVSKLVYPTVTSIEQPTEEMAKAACKMLLARIEDPELPAEKVVLEGKLIKRNSTGSI